MDEENIFSLDIGDHPLFNQAKEQSIVSEEVVRDVALDSVDLAFRCLVQAHAMHIPMLFNRRSQVPVRIGDSSVFRVVPGDLGIDPGFIQLRKDAVTPGSVSLLEVFEEIAHFSHFWINPSIYSQKMKMIGRLRKIPDKKDVPFSLFKEFVWFSNATEFVAAIARWRAIESRSFINTMKQRNHVWHETKISPFHMVDKETSFCTGFSKENPFESRNVNYHWALPAAAKYYRETRGRDIFDLTRMSVSELREHVDSIIGLELADSFEEVLGGFPPERFKDVFS